MMELTLIKDGNHFCIILMAQFVFYAILTLYLERRSTFLKEGNWRNMFNFRSTRPQGFANLNEGFLIKYNYLNIII